MKNSGTLLTADKVAQMTGLSLDTLARWRSHKVGIPYLKIGRAVRYGLADVEAYLESCRIRVAGPRVKKGQAGPSPGS